MDADGSSSETLDSCEDQRKKNAYCSTTNRLYLSLCHSIVWNVCEHYENKIREKQAAVAARFPGTPVTSSGADASIVRGGANVNGECAVPVHSETVEKAGIVTSAEPDVGEHQYEDFVGLLNDAFSKHEELRNDATDQKELSNWRANYVEQHGVLTGAMEINAQLCRDLIAAKNQNNTLKKQLVNDAQAVQCADAQQRQEHTPLSKPDSDANLLSAGGSNGHVEDCEKVELRKKIALLEETLVKKDQLLHAEKNRLKETYINYLKTSKDKVDKELTAKDAEIAQLKSTLNGREAATAVLSGACDRAQEEISAARTKIVMLTEKAQSFAKRASDLEQEHLCLLEKDKKRLEEQLKWESIIAQQQQEIESLRRKVTECDGSLEVQDNKLKDKMIQTMATKLEETAKELASKNFALDNLKGSLQKKAAEIASLNGRCARFSAEVEAAVKLTIDKLEDRFVPERERFQQTQKALNEELKKLRAAYADQKTELDSLKDTLLETGGALSDEKACAKNLTADNEKLTVKLKQREEQVWQVTAKKDKEIVELNLRCENSANEVLQVTAEKDKEIAELNLRFENSASEVLQVTAKKDKEIAELNMRCMIAANDLETAQGTIAQLREQLNCCQKAQADKDEKVSRLQGVLEQLRQSRERSEPKSLPATDTRTVDPAVKLNDSVPPVVESDATHTLNKDLPKSVSGTASAETTLPTTSAVQTKTSFVQPVASSSVEAVRPASLSKPTSSGSATPTEPVHPVVHPSARDAARPYPKPSRGRGARRRGNQLVYRGNSNRGIPHPPHHGAYFGHGHGLPQDFADDSFSWGDRTYW